MRVSCFEAKALHRITRASRSDERWIFSRPWPSMYMELIAANCSRPLGANVSQITIWVRLAGSRQEGSRSLQANGVMDRHVHVRCHTLQNTKQQSCWPDSITHPSGCCSISTKGPDWICRYVFKSENTLLWLLLGLGYIQYQASQTKALLRGKPLARGPKSPLESQAPIWSPVSSSRSHTPSISLQFLLLWKMNRRSIFRDSIHPSWHDCRPLHGLYAVSVRSLL